MSYLFVVQLLEWVFWTVQFATVLIKAIKHNQTDFYTKFKISIEFNYLTSVCYLLTKWTFISLQCIYDVPHPCNGLRITWTGYRTLPSPPHASTFYYFYLMHPCWQTMTYTTAERLLVYLENSSRYNITYKWTKKILSQ